MSLFFCFFFFFFAAWMVDPVVVRAVVVRPVVLRPVVLRPVVLVVVDEETHVVAASVTTGTVAAIGVTSACVTELGGADAGTGEGRARTGGAWAE